MTREALDLILRLWHEPAPFEHDAAVPDSDVTAEYCARHNWIVGSPDTVAEKIEHIYHEVAGFGQLLVFGFDYADNPEGWHHSLDLLVTEVLPRLSHLVAGALAA